MSTLPLLWAEADSVSELLTAEASKGWVSEELGARHTIQPLDTLEAEPLSKLGYLVLAQPRPLSPAENVALDNWVRAGGRLLLFADPMLTRHSRYPIGDRRRPQDVVLLSPILSHWSLELRFDPDLQGGEGVVDVEGLAVPVDLPGSFAAGPEAECQLLSGGLVAQCRIGKGRVIALADAAVLDDAEDANLSPRREALRGLLKRAFD